MGIYETLKYTASSDQHHDTTKPGHAGGTKASHEKGKDHVSQEVKDLWAQAKAEEAKREAAKKEGGK